MAIRSKYAPTVQRSRWQCVLGQLLLHWTETVNLPFGGFWLGRTNCLHLGRFCVHVHWHLAGHSAPREAQEAVESCSSGSIDHAPFGRIPFASGLVEQAHLPHFSDSPKLGFKFGNYRQDAPGWNLPVNATVDVGIWPWMIVHVVPAPGGP
jgi:hypothetical protein